ncbi:MAG: chloride channel protein [Bacteroidetes bacterium]|nr:chloride channel protein [Bacteroidota bacterium]
METTKPGNIPISVSLKATLDSENITTKSLSNKRRILFISFIAVIVAIAISLIAKILIYLIDLIVNISFYGKFSITNASPETNNLGWWVVVVPIIGGLIVGLMALYGSKAIRGHGIPEAMEQILTNQSKIKPTITYLKPLSSAISIGTGGPFGAEGPIIATGGALGSTLGQLLKISHHERKIILAAGATAGMSAIFGSPIAAIFLAIELLLFEFSPRSIIPVAFACITGAAGHHFLFGHKPVFAIDHIIQITNNIELIAYSLMGIIIGFISVGATKLVYLIEDAFEKLPIHWMWWPAIGGVAVGIVGYFEPKTLGVGYDNIANLLAGNFTFQMVISLCLLKFISWAIALGSGTSGGTLAPLLTIGGAVGIIIGTFFIYLFPNLGLNLSLAALVGMAAMFAGASRAFITSIVFALETTGQTSALLPLLATCSTSFLVSFFIMENTIMTEKIARRGIKTPDSYEPDILEKVTVSQMMDNCSIILNSNETVEDTVNWLNSDIENKADFYVVSNTEGEFQGVISLHQLYNKLTPQNEKLINIIYPKNNFIDAADSLKSAAELMAKETTEVLIVISQDHQNIVGLISHSNLITSYKFDIEEHLNKKAILSVKRGGIKLMIKGQKIKFKLSAVKNKFKSPS